MYENSRTGCIIVKFHIEATFFVLQLFLTSSSTLTLHNRQYITIIIIYQYSVHTLSMFNVISAFWYIIS